MTPAAATRLRLLASVLSVVLLVAVLAAGWFFWRLRASLPQLAGEARLAGLGAAVTVERDAQGVPTIRGANRADVARALGWLHAQDRFFQMDLQRRGAAGELAELFGKVILPRDRAARLHGFRARARTVVEKLPPEQRALLEAYTAGVNAGLASLRARPFEYILLRTDPEPWKNEDSVLVAYAITLDLQDDSGTYERTLMTLRDELGLDALAFFNPLVGPNDAALDGSTAPLPPIPGPRMLDLREPKSPARTGRVASEAGGELEMLAAARGLDSSLFSPARDAEQVPGSNAFALAGPLAGGGAALVANDMHLGLRVPNIWYRAVLEWPEPAAPDGRRRLVGVTLPGAFSIVVGSNGQIAWGLTNAPVDTGDLVVVESLFGLENYYAAPGHPDGLKLETRTETIRVKGEDPVTVNYTWTIWGPVVGKDERGRSLAFRWTAHDPDAMNFALVELEHARTVADAVGIAHRTGLPPLNLTVADAAGDIAWTILGKIPRRHGYDGRLPVSWRYGDRYWDGYLRPEEIPVFTTSTAIDTPATQRIPKPEGRLWSANERQVGGDALARIGDGDYVRPARSAQIRDRLRSLSNAAPSDLLKIQLDARALFLAPWHALLMQTLTPEVASRHKGRAALRRFAEPWEGEARTDAVSYLLVRDFRIAVYARVFGPIFASCREANPDFNSSSLQLEPAAWALLRERPAHLLNPDFESWDAVLVAAIDDVIARIDRDGVAPPRLNWGHRNAARIRHPFGNLVPEWLSGWLSMPPDPLPGDVDMPRMQAPDYGASERLVVAPGREAEGIFHMPGGQSAHPWSDFYRAGHEAWVRGEPTPLLPGKTAHTLRLAP